MAPRVAALSPLGNTALEGDLTLAMSAELEDRQEARRRMSPGGKVLQDVGADSEDGQQAEQRQQPLLSLFSPSSSASGGLSIPGGPGLDHLPPSERYWRERASLMGGRCSLDAHAAKVRERRQVQADLKAWVEDVLDGQQQQLQPYAGKTDKQQLVSSTADSRWSDLPADLYYQLTGQRLPGSAAVDTSPGHRHHHHHRHRHSIRGRKSTRSSQQLYQQQAGEVVPSQQQQQQQQQMQAQSGSVAGCSEATVSSVSTGGGLYLTPRTAQEFGDGLRQQFQEKVDALVQQQVQQAAQQWQQANLVDQQLLLQLKQEHEKLQLQLAQAHQQIAALTQRAGSTAAVFPNSEQHEVLVTPLPHVQILTNMRQDEQPRDGALDNDEAVAAYPRWPDGNNQQPGAGTRHRQEQTLGAVAADEQVPKAIPRRGVVGTAIGSGARAKAASTSTSNKKPPVQSAVAAPGTKSSQRTGSSTAVDSNRKLDSEQKQALLARLQDAESVMELLQSDLQSSLKAQQQLADQLQAAQAQPTQQQQRQQNHLQLGFGSQQQGQAPSSSSSEQQQVVCELKHQVVALGQQLAAGQQQLVEAQMSAADARDQLHQQHQLQTTLEQRCGQQAQAIAELESQVVQLQQQCRQQWTASNSHARAAVTHSSTMTQHLDSHCVEQEQTPESHIACVADDVSSPKQAIKAQQTVASQESGGSGCVQCQQLDSEVQQLQMQLQAQQNGAAAAARTLADSAQKALAVPGTNSTCSSSGTANSQRGEQRGIKSQLVPMSTILCPPPPPQVAVLQQCAAAPAAVAPHAGVCSAAEAVSTGLSSLRGQHLSSSSWEDAAASYSIPLAGLHRMRPLSSRVDTPSRQVDDSIRGVSMLSGNTVLPSAHSPVDRGAPFLQLIGECASGAAIGRASSRSLLVQQPASQSGMQSSRQSTAMVCAAAAAADDYQSMYRSLQLKGRSISPRHRAATARPATAEPVVQSAADANGLSWVLQAVLSPHRPQTALTIPSKMTAASTHPTPRTIVQNPGATVLHHAAGGAGVKQGTLVKTAAGSTSAEVAIAMRGVAGPRASAVNGRNSSRGLHKPGQVPKLNLASIQSQLLATHC